MTRLNQFINGNDNFDKKLMSKYTYFIILLFTSLIGSAQNSAVCTWAVQPIIVDGNVIDWNLPLKNYDQDTKLFFDIRNDANNLYLCFQTNDRMNEAKIMRSGMRIILSNKINGKHKSVINFPLPSNHVSRKNQQDEEVNEDQSSMKQNMRATFLESDTVMEVKGFTNKDGIIRANDTSNIHASINFGEDNSIIYEIAVPLKEMFGSDYNQNELTKEISLSVIINGASHSSVNTSSGNNFQRPSNKFGARAGSSNRNTDQINGRTNVTERNTQTNDRSPMFEKSELKQKFVLASHS